MWMSQNKSPEARCKEAILNRRSLVFWKKWKNFWNKVLLLISSISDCSKDATKDVFFQLE